MALMTAACGGPASHTAAPTTSASPNSSAATPHSPGSSAHPPKAATAFLQRYVTTDGRVIRHDQGGDIVSEGQAYGMLIAELAGDPAKAATIWNWTRRHLQNSAGLIAWHASGDGKVLDSQSATDADVLIAYALLRYSGHNADAMHRAGRRIAGAVFAHESATLPDGRPVLVAGPWALRTPAVVEPSYLMPGVFDALASLTGDHRWSAAADAAVSLMAQLTDSGRQLPPDWARLQSGRLVAAAAPSGSPPVQYGLNAQRIPVWFATSCSAQAQQLAAAWWSLLSVDDRGTAIALSVKGQVYNATKHPLPMVAAAAAAKAAGDSASSEQLMAKAAAQSAESPTYYGDAWLALGQALLDGTLASCR